jgi:hypothetical protein
VDVSAVKVKTFAELMDEAPSKGKASEAKVKVDAKPVDVSAVKVKTFAELMAEKWPPLLLPTHRLSNLFSFSLAKKIWRLKAISSSVSASNDSASVGGRRAGVAAWVIAVAGGRRHGSTPWDDAPLLD